MSFFPKNKEDLSGGLHLFTSITANYIPKARVLAHSIKRFHPESRFHLVLSDSRPKELEADGQPFDSILLIEDLPIPESKAWIFKHSVVEMCTGVKGWAFQEIIARHNPSHIFYFDPDIAVFSDLHYLLGALQKASILLTPHLIHPESSLEGILDNEICSLRHGIYNLGFLGVRPDAESHRFLSWWTSRLENFCYDDIPAGLFTDQRWVDLAPAFFENIHIVREPAFNVATWNLTHRQATGSLQDGIRINGAPLCFIHFSGLDSGAQEAMLNKYGGNSPVLQDARRWYIQECLKMGQERLGRIPCKYNQFDNGETITRDHRHMYRIREDLQKAFPNPFQADDIHNSYYHWYQVNGELEKTSLPQLRNEPDLHANLSALQKELNMIKNSRSFKAARFVSSVTGSLFKVFRF